MGDRPGWDGLVEAFPERFHEPYYRHYAIDDLEGIFTAAGLEPELTTTPFLSKLMVRRKRRAGVIPEFCGSKISGTETPGTKTAAGL
jgi:hypothetical protein